VGGVDEASPGGTEPVPVAEGARPVAVGTTLDVEETAGPAASSPSALSAPNEVHARYGTTMATPSNPKA
jgi:hypothetical protein